MQKPGLAEAMLVLTMLNVGMAQIGSVISNKYSRKLNDDSDGRFNVTCECACNEKQTDHATNIQGAVVETPNLMVGRKIDHVANDVSVKIFANDPRIYEYDTSDQVTDSQTDDPKFNVKETNQDTNAVDCEYVPSHQCHDQQQMESQPGSDMLVLLESPPEVCCKLENIIRPGSELSNFPVQPKKCGQLIYPIKNGLSDIIGKELRFGEFPWVVEIYTQPKNNSGERKEFCVGTLIHPQAVLTLASCVYRKTPETVNVFIGDFDGRSQRESSTKQYRRVRRVIVYEKFRQTMVFDNFAILILSTPVVHKNAKPLCLPEENTQFDSFNCFTIRANTNLRDDLGSGRTIFDLMKLPVIPFDSCTDKFILSIRPVNPRKDHSSLCVAPDHGTDSCKIRAGTPLVCSPEHDPHSYILAGIAKKDDCNDFGDPVMYDNVTAVRTWIIEQLQRSHLEIN